jgi:hypothetical protein
LFSNLSQRSTLGTTRNKVNPTIKSAINAQLDVQYMQGKLNPQNLEQAYKAAYEPYKAFIEQTQREALKSYVPAKKPTLIRRLHSLKVPRLLSPPKRQRNSSRTAKN